MADSKLENPSKDSDKFRCPICLEEVRIPKYLPCYHTFCKSCIQTYISSTAACSGDNSSKTIQCPVCRKSIQAPRNDASSEEWACSLSEDKLILSMSVESDSSENQYCMFCQRNDKTVQAKHWCKTCTETICDDCKSFHSFVPMLQGHKIVTLSDSLDLTNDIEIDEPCIVHKGKYLEVFCQDHDQLCCSICFATKHRTCKKVEAIEDKAMESDESSFQIEPICLKALLKKLEGIQDEYMTTVANLNVKKQEISSFTETKVEEIKSLLDQVHNQWTKTFEQNHSDAVSEIEIASDEVKRFATTVQEAKTLLQRVLENGSKKQVFLSRYKVRQQILDHVDRLRDLKIWDVVHDYNQPDTDFLRQVCEDKTFQDVKMIKRSSTTMKRVSEFTSILQKNNILHRRQIMSRKDWMKVRFKKLSEIKLPSMVYYGLFVGDNEILLSVENPPSLQLYDITDANARCVHSYSCSATPYGLCHSGESMDKVYVSFNTYVEHYEIVVIERVSIQKIETIMLKTPMRVLSRGSTMLFTRSSSEKMVCTSDFSVKQNSKVSSSGNPPYISASFNSDQHAFIKNSCVQVVDQYNEEVFKTETLTTKSRGLAFDIQDNIFICLKSKMIKQIKYGGCESRDIELPGIQQAYNVVLHPTGEKVLILDFCGKNCIYKVI